MKDADLNILLSSSGMCDVGPIVPHLIRELPRSESCIVLTGYADPATVGGKLRAASRTSDGKISDSLRFGEADVSPSKVAARIEDMGGYYSGHADSGGLIDFVFRRGNERKRPSSSCRVFINHGDDKKREELAQAIKLRSDWNGPSDCSIDGIEQPMRAPEWFDLDLGAWTADDSGTAQEDTHSILLKLFLEQRRTNDLLAELLRAQRQPHYAGKPAGKPVFKKNE